jgi:hypothetical protein
VRSYRAQEKVKHIAAQRSMANEHGPSWRCVVIELLLSDAIMSHSMAAFSVTEPL